MKSLKWIGFGIAGLVIAAIIFFGVIYIIGSLKFSRTYDVTPAAVQIPEDPESIEHGAYLYAASCSACHGEDAGGKEVFNDPKLATFYATNLTAGEGGIGAYYNEVDYVRAIRHGISPNGKALAIMPSRAYWHYSDRDLGAIIAFLKNIPPVDRQWEPRSVTPVGKVLVALGVFDILAAEHIDHDSARGSAPARGVTAAYGQYIVETGDCALCHGADLAGGVGPAPGAPQAPNLTPGGQIQGWSADEFITAMRTGVTPDGRGLNEASMPWRELALLNDDDLNALYLYLQSLDPIEDSTE